MKFYESSSHFDVDDNFYSLFPLLNLIFVLFWYQIYCMFSGQNHIDQIYLIVFHLLFTSLPPIVLGILDQDLPENVLMSHPRLYKQGPQNKVDYCHNSVIEFTNFP